jgi:periplasmic protein TonB
MEFPEHTHTEQDRLVTALFVAALLHGLVILGIRFSGPPSDANALPTLEVLLVADGPEQEANLDASYIAQRNQRGSGTTRDRARPSLPEPSPGLFPQADAASEELPAPAERTAAGDASALTARSADAQRMRAGSDREQTPSARPPLMLQALPQIAQDSGAMLPELVLRGDTAAGAELLADTRASQIARYLHGWKLRVERVGTLNFPNEARRRALSGNPVLEVAIGADGALEQVVVRRSSGHAELDQAAVNIVRLASPFDPFPTAMRESYPVLRFAYEWQFLEDRLGAGTVRTGSP